MERLGSKKKINNDNVVKHNSFANFVYDRYIKEYNEEGISLKICDIGSGNSHDIKFFHDKKNLCYGVDMNGTLNVESINCKLIKKDAEFVLEKYQMKTLFDVVYMKHLLHEIPYEKSESILKNAVRNLKINGLLCVEVFSMKEGFKKQSTNDGSNEKSFSNREMWLYTEDICKKLANDNNCEILYYEEGYFSQNTETQNQLVIRLVCKKRQLPYYTKSENYSRYKQMYESSTRNTIENFKSIYWNLTQFNKLVEKHGIKYTAVGGTLLGLVRHGGIIPWDVDLDLGLISSEWEKLLAISDVFTELRINIHRHNNNHIHFGHMDCFKLEDMGEYYIGEAKTICSKEDYENVKKQVFGYSHLYAPLSGNVSLEKRYSENYFTKGNVSDHFHIEWQTDLFGEKGDTRLFDLNHNDLVYAITN